MTIDARAGDAPLDGHRVHLVGHAHIDPVWIWDWREGVGEIWATFRSALDRLAEHDEVTFTASSAAHYAWIERIDPAMFDQIVDAVRSGRWRVVGGMWVEPDCNLPSGESLCRQLLLGQRFFKRSFERIATIGFNVDSFGHQAGLPQLLAAAGLRAYVMMRPGPHELDLPAAVFSWTDPSGSAVLATRLSGDYATTSPDHVRGQLDEVSDLTKVEGGPLMCFYGIGNHGGGPTKAMISAVDDARATRPQVTYSDPESFFADWESSAHPHPIVSGELQHHAVGCYSVSAWVKAANRRAETALLDAEAWSVVAESLGKPSAASALTHAWETLALGQFHDVLAGTASTHANARMRGRFGYVETVADEALTASLYEVTHHIDTRIAAIVEPARENLWAKGQVAASPYVLFNPLAWAVSAAVEIPRSAREVRDSAGRMLASQAVTSGESTIYPSHTLTRVDLPALGYEVLWLSGGRMRPTDSVSSPSATRLANGRFVVEVSPTTGVIESLADAATSRELLGPEGMRAVVLADPSDTWSHGLARFEGEEQVLLFDGSEVIEDGPVRQVLRLRYGFGASRLRLDVVLSEHAPFVELALRAEWTSPHCMVKLVVPWALSSGAELTAGAAYSHQPRAFSGDEDVFQGWLDAYDPHTNHGLGITTDHLYGCDATFERLRLSVLRNPLAADHGGTWAVRVGEDFALSDSGSHAASVRLHPHVGRGAAELMEPRAAEHHRPPQVIAETYHTGELAGRGSFLTVDPPRPLVRVVKRAEGARGVVMRLVETSGSPLTVTLSGGILGRPVVTSLDAYEVRTLFVPDDVGAPARVVPITELDGDDSIR